MGAPSPRAAAGRVSQCPSGVQSRAWLSVSIQMTRTITLHAPKIYAVLTLYASPPACRVCCIRLFFFPFFKLQKKYILKEINLNLKRSKTLNSPPPLTSISFSEIIAIDNIMQIFSERSMHVYKMYIYIYSVSFILCIDT